MVNALAPQDTQLGAAETFLLLQSFQPCSLAEEERQEMAVVQGVETRGGGMEKPLVWHHLLHNGVVAVRVQH